MGLRLGTLGSSAGEDSSFQGSKVTGPNFSDGVVQERGKFADFHGSRATGSSDGCPFFNLRPNLVVWLFVWLFVWSWFVR